MTATKAASAKPVKAIDREQLNALVSLVPEKLCEAWWKGKLGERGR